MQSLWSSPLCPAAGWTRGEYVLALRGAPWKLPMVSERSSVSGGTWVSSLRCSNCEIAGLAWLPSCVCCPPRLNLWTRRRLVPDPAGGSGVDIVSFGSFSGVVRLYVPELCVLLLPVSVLLCSIFSWLVGLSGRLGFDSVLIVFVFESLAATVGLIVTVEFCWGVCLFS
jgi:hypothetical protein